MGRSFANQAPTKESHPIHPIQELPGSALTNFDLTADASIRHITIDKSDRLHAFVVQKITEIVNGDLANEVQASKVKAKNSRKQTSCRWCASERPTFHISHRKLAFLKTICQVIKDRLYDNDLFVDIRPK